MTRYLTAAAALALAVSGPAFADKGGNGGGNGKDHHGGPAHAKGGDRDDKSKAKGVARDARPDRAAVVERARYEGGDRSYDRGREYSRDRDYDRYRDDRGERWASGSDCPPGLAKKNNGCLPPGQAKKYDERAIVSYRDYDPRDSLRLIDYRPSFFGYGDRYPGTYAYRDGYLVSTGPQQVLIPLLGGALAVGQVWPSSYQSRPLPEWQSRYYGFDGPDYRYSDNVVYRIDPESAAIQSVAALLTGSDFTVGQRVPMGYDVYNVPYAYRSRYADSDEALYRYADGRIYEIDPVTMLVAQAIDAVL